VFEGAGSSGVFEGAGSRGVFEGARSRGVFEGAGSRGVFEGARSRGVFEGAGSRGVFEGAGSLLFVGLARTVNVHCMFGDLPAEITVYSPHLMVLVNPICKRALVSMRT